MIRRYLTLGGLLLIAVLFAIWQSGYHGIDLRLIFWPPPAEIPPPAALDEPAELDVADVPLSDVLDQLAAKHNVSIEFDSFTKSSTGLTGTEPVSLHLSGVSLRSLLSHLAREFDLVVHTRAGIVYLTTPSDWENNLSNYVPRTYPLARLLASPYPFDEEQVADLVTTLLAPTNWEDAGGTGVCTPLPGGLVVSQTPELQDQVARLLDKLAELNKEPATTEPVWLDPPTKRTEAVIASLKQTANIDCEKQPLAKVLEQLSRSHSVPIQIHRTALENVGLSGQSPVNLRLKDVSLGSVLAHLLRPLELTFAIRDEAILITTPEVADNCLDVRLYPVADLFDRRRDIDTDALIDTMTTIVAPTTWEDAGGAGAIDSFGGNLVVWQTHDVHEQLEEALARVRQARSSETPLSPKFQPTPARARLEDSLAGKVSLNFDREPLEKIVEWLRKEQGIAALLEQKALDGEAINPSVPITFQADDIPLERTLRWLLAPHGLAPMVRRETLAITTHEVADNALETRCYRIRRTTPPPVKLARYHVGQGMVADFDPFIDMLTTNIAPTTWEDAGGAGSIDTVGDVLIVSQTRDVQELIGETLSRLGEMSHAAPRARPIWIGEAAEERYAQLDAILAKPASLAFKDLPLEKALASLSTEHRLPFGSEWQVSPHELEHLVACDIPAVPLRLGLDLMLREVGLAYNVRHGVVEVSEMVRDSQGLHLRLFDVRHLLDSAGDSRRDVVRNRPGRVLLSAFSLDEIVAGFVAPETWEDVGGPGSLALYEGVLIVAQTRDVHRQVELFLTTLDKLPREPSDHLPMPYDDTSLARAAELDALLSRRASIKFQDRPLADELSHFAGEQGLPLLIDHGPFRLFDDALKESCLFERENIQLGEALDELCDVVGGHWKQRDGAIVFSADRGRSSSPDLAPQTIRLYPIADMLRTAGETQQRSAAKLPYYLARLREVTANPFEQRPPEERSFEQAMERYFSAYSRVTHIEIQWAIHGNYLLVGASRRAAHHKLERFLAELRRLRAAPEAGRPAPVGVATGQSPWGLEVYDLRPILKRFPELDQWRLEDWVADQGFPNDWARFENAIQNIIKRTVPPPPLSAWEGLLVAEANNKQDRWIHEALELLSGPLEGFPSLAHLARGEPQAAARLAALIETEPDPRRLDFAIWLARRVAKPAPDLARALIRRLEREDEPVLCARIYWTLGTYGPLAADAVPLISAHLRRNAAATRVETAAHQWLRIETLGTLGPRGAAELGRLAARETWSQSSQEVLRDSPWRRAGMEAILPSLVDSACDQKQVLALLAGIDLPEAYSVLDEWREKSGDPELRRIAIAAEKVLVKQFGESVKK